MNRTLRYVIITLLVVLVCWRFGGFRAAAQGPWFWSGDDGESSDTGPITSRDYAWDGDDRLELDIPSHVHFHPAPTWHLSIRGREGALDRIEVSDGRIRTRDEGFSFFGWHRSHPVQIDLSGPALHRATLNGSGTIELTDIDQDRLRVEIRGSGSAMGNGKVQSLELQIMGSGSAHLARVAETNADVTIDGSGDADVAPTGDVQVMIAGSGDVRLHGHPAHVTSHIYGSGGVSEVSSDAPGTAAQPAGSVNL